MNIKLIDLGFKIDITPLEEILLKNSKLIILLDDSEEKRWSISFAPFQSMNIVSDGCLASHKIKTIPF